MTAFGRLLPVTIDRNRPKADAYRRMIELSAAGAIKLMSDQYFAHLEEARGRGST